VTATPAEKIKARLSVIRGEDAAFLNMHKRLRALHLNIASAARRRRLVRFLHGGKTERVNEHAN